MTYQSLRATCSCGNNYSTGGGKKWTKKNLDTWLREHSGKGHVSRQVKVK